MAVKIDKPVDPVEVAARAAREDAARAAAEHEVLHPNRVIEIAGRAVTVREYEYVEGMVIQSGAAPFLEDLFAAFPREGAPPAASNVDLNALLARHIHIVHWMIAHAITTPRDATDPDSHFAELSANAKWIGGLNDVEGDLLAVCWWGVNKGFFIRRLQRLQAADQVANGAPSATPRSTAH